MLIFNVRRQNQKGVIPLPIIIFKYFVIAIISLTMCVPAAYAAEIMLAWDRNPEADIAGYKMHFGTSSGYYSSEIDVGNYTTCVISDLSAGRTYYFAATAYNTSNIESGYSGEIQYTVPEDSAPVIPNEPPVANAGSDQTVNEGTTVMLNGLNSSDPDDGIQSYRWTQIGGQSVSLSNASAVRPTFTAPDVDAGGASLTFRLTVTDGGGLQSTDTCIVNVTWGNEAPVADAGADQIVSAGASVTLDGSDSRDPENGIASYRWVQTGGTSVALSSASAVLLRFTAPAITEGSASLTFRLTVTDNHGLQSSDTCIVNVSATNQVPIANAGPDQVVDEGTTVTLNGSQSVDRDGSIVSYLWTQTAGPAVTLSDAAIATPTFVTVPVDAEGTTLVFNLTVRDSAGLESSDTVSVTINDNEITEYPEKTLTITLPNGKTIGVEIDDNGDYVTLRAIDSSTISGNSEGPKDLIYELIDMTIKVRHPGAATKVSLCLPGATPEGYNLFHYNRYTARWSDYSDYAAFNRLRNMVTFTLVDGGVGDDDGIANGIIVDPFAIGTTTSSAIPSAGADESGGGGGGCFIATAATCGSSMESGSVLPVMALLILALLVIVGIWRRHCTVR